MKLEPGGLEQAEGMLDPGQALVGSDDLIGAHGVGIKAGAGDVEAIQAGLGRDGLPVARPTAKVLCFQHQFFIIVTTWRLTSGWAEDCA